MSYLDEVAFAVTVCDKNGVIIYMNENQLPLFYRWWNGTCWEISA